MIVDHLTGKIKRKENGIEYQSLRTISLKDIKRIIDNLIKASAMMAKHNHICANVKEFFELVLDDINEDIKDILPNHQQITFEKFLEMKEYE